MKTPIILLAVLAIVAGSCGGRAKEAKEAQTENTPDDGTKQMTMTTSKEGLVEIRLAGTGTAVINWGDGTPNDTVPIVPYNTKAFPYIYTTSGARTITITGDSITTLYCDNNQLTALDVSKNTKLTNLYCSGNQLTTLDVSKNTYLRELYCGGNRLTVLDVRNNTALKHFSCGYNQLATLDVSKNTELISVSCYNNQLTALDVRNNTVLGDLWCSNNQLTALDVSKNTAIRYLYCNNNQLTAAALDALFETLPEAEEDERKINIGYNPGTDACNRDIATGKGWIVDVDWGKQSVSSQVEGVLFSEIRPNETLQLNTVYTDTVEYDGYRRYSDHTAISALMYSGREAELICNDINQMASVLKWERGDIIEVQWKIDTLRTDDDKALREHIVKITKLQDACPVLSYKRRYPPVSPEVVAAIAPVIKKWTKFYNIDFSQARLVDSSENVCFLCPPDTTSLYYLEFLKKHDTEKRMDVDYSPDKQRYVDLGISVGIHYDEDDKKYYFIGWDDCQAIYLTDRKQKQHDMILWFGTSTFAEAVFWKSNDVFMVTGYTDTGYDMGAHFVYVFDIKNQTINRYQIIITEENHKEEGYMNAVYLKEKGIFAE